MCDCIALRRLAREDAPMQLSIPQVPGVRANAATVHRIKCACMCSIAATFRNNGRQVVRRCFVAMFMWHCHYMRMWMQISSRCACS
jgi:hypothetical protein